MNAERGIRYDLDDIFLSRRIGMDRENIEAYRKEARRKMEGGRGAGRGARVGPRPALMTAEVPRHSFASLPPPWGSLRLPPPHRLVRVMRPGYYLFPLVCARSTRSSRQTNNLPFERRHCRPTGSTLSLSLSLSLPPPPLAPTCPPLSR